MSQLVSASMVFWVMSFASQTSYLIEPVVSSEGRSSEEILFSERSIMI